MAKLLVHAFISSRLDYCNSLLMGVADGLLKRLQLVQNLLLDLLLAPENSTTSHQCCAPYTGCQCVSGSSTRSPCSSFGACVAWLHRIWPRIAFFCLQLTAEIERGRRPIGSYTYRELGQLRLVIGPSLSLVRLPGTACHRFCDTRPSLSSGSRMTLKLICLFKHMPAHLRSSDYPAFLKFSY